MGENGSVLLMRVALPDRPGSLGVVATAMGTVGADISAVEIVERNDARVIEDFMLELPTGVMPDSLVSACTQLEDVRVLWLSHFPENWGLESDLEVLNRMTEDPDQAAEILAAAGPWVFHCHWAVLANRATREPIFATTLAPDLHGAAFDQFGALDTPHRVELAHGWLQHWSDSTCVVAPVHRKRVIILGRQGGPGWLPSEVARLRFLAGMTHGAQRATKR